MKARWPSRICLVTPRHLSTNPRIVKEADALQEAGYLVSVISGDFSAWGREADCEFSDRPWWPPRRVTFGPLSDSLTRISQVTRQRLAHVALKAGMNGESLQCAAFDQAARGLAQEAMATPADLYIAHYDAALPAVARAAARRRGLYAFDAEDFHLGDLPDIPRYRHDNALIDAIERRYLPGCAHVTAGSPGIADAYAKAYGLAAPTVVLNVFPLAQRPERIERATQSPRPSLYWFSQTIGLDRGLQCAIKAIGRASSSPHLFLRGAVTADVSSILLALAREVGAHERLHILPPAPPNEMVRLAAHYDAGFVGETGQTLNRRIALTNKQFTYILAGLPVFMSDIPAHRDFAARALGAALMFPVDDSAALATQMDRLFRDPESLAAARCAAWELGDSRFNWDVEKSKLLDRVARTLEASGAEQRRLRSQLS